jgi:hypothetical protein
MNWIFRYNLDEIQASEWWTKKENGFRFHLYLSLSFVPEVVMSQSPNEGRQRQNHPTELLSLFETHFISLCVFLIFVARVMSLLGAQTVFRSVVQWLAKSELETIWKEFMEPYFMELSHYLLGGSGESRDNAQENHLSSCMRTRDLKKKNEALVFWRSLVLTPRHPASGFRSDQVLSLTYNCRNFVGHVSAGRMMCLLV